MPWTVDIAQELQRMPEDEVIARAKQGWRPAIEYLLRQYHGLVEAKARTYFLLGADREDLIQEGRIGLFKAIRDFTPHSMGSFRSFATLCVTRQIISAVKGANRHKHCALNAYVSMDGGASDGSDEALLREMMASDQTCSPELVILQREFESRVSGEMDRSLSRLERGVLREYLKGGSYRDIARQLGCKVKQVDNALQRAKKKLERHVHLGILNSQK